MFSGNYTETNLTTLKVSMSFTSRNSSMTYTVVNTLYKVTEFLFTCFCCVFATVDAICALLQLLLHLLAVLLIATFILQNFLRILQTQRTSYNASYSYLVRLWQMSIDINPYSLSNERLTTHESRPSAFRQNGRPKTEIVQALNIDISYNQL